MIEIKVDRSQIEALMQRFPRQVAKAAEKALDNTARLAKAAVAEQLPRVFDKPTPFTLNSLQVKLTQNHNGVAWVWFKNPSRMTDHYLVPEVEGGPRHEKGLEKGVRLGPKGGMARFYMPSRSAELDQYGNLARGGGRVKQILSVLKSAEAFAGHSSNQTKRSAIRNKKDRDYVLLRERHGKLPPGIYQRFVEPGREVNKKISGQLGGAWQRGQKTMTYRKKEFFNVVRATGVRPVMIEIRPETPYRPRLPFYAIVRNVYNQAFRNLFDLAFGEMMGRRR